ncbi:MAG TPA: SgcJ/EcaC family oxidoreductase [Terracidiphilus sp.]|nr:SgcJ/EcaC family oxidoreductase [Terracidiphilus sp.]
MLAVHASTVEELLTLVKDSWNRHDMVTYAAQFAADAVYVNAIGQEWRGHAEIERGHIVMHRSIFKDSRITRMTNRTQMIAEGVVICTSDWEMEGAQPPDGWIMHHPRQGVMTLVLAEREGRWWIVAGQNTQKTEVELTIE